MRMLTWRTFGGSQLLSFGNVCAPSTRIGNGFKSWKRCSPAACVTLEKATRQYRLHCTCWERPGQAPRSEMSPERLAYASGALARCSLLKLAFPRSCSAVYCDLSARGLWRIRKDLVGHS